MLDLDDEFWEIIERNRLQRRPPEPDEITYRVRVNWDDVIVSLIGVALLIGALALSIKKGSGM